MTRNFSPLYPDCLAGALCAFEGLRGAQALLNGPTGCKYYHSYLVDRQDPAGFSFDPIPFGERFYFGQPRVPATAVEGEDYVYGTAGKVRQLLEHIKTRSQIRLLGIVNSPGPTLIGDALQREAEAAGILQPVVYIESPGFSNSWADGYQNAMLEILKRISYPPQAREQSGSERVRLNLLGFMIGQHNWADDLKEVQRMLHLLGLESHVNLGAGEEVENLSRLPGAGCNLVLAEEYSSRIAHHLKERFGQEIFGAELLAPYGIEATEIWGYALSERFGLDTSCFEKEAEAVRRKCYSAISRVASVRGVPRGLEFAIFGDGYQVAPLCLFLYRYLGMYPAVIALRECGDTSRQFLEEFLAGEKLNGTIFLQSPNAAQIAEAFRSTRPDIVFGSNFEEHILATEVPDSVFIGTAFPVWNRFQLTERPLMGLRGVLVLVEEILNALSHRVDLPE